MIEPSVLRAMLAAGATAEMVVAAVEADYAVEQEKLAVKRARDAERKREKRLAESDGQRGHGWTKRKTPRPPKEK